MRLLLDTHCLLWWWTDDPRLSRRVRNALQDPGNEIYVSAASGWEVATKIRLGKLDGLGQAWSRFEELVEADGFSHLSITTRHALAAGAFPQEHRDPFDRMLAAQALAEDLYLVTADPAIVVFGARVFW